MNKHTMSDLYQMQAVPLSIKIRMMIPELRENPQVQKTLQEIIERFPDREVIDY